MKTGMQQLAAGKTLSPEQQRVLDAVPAKFAAVMREEFTWASLRPAIVQLYRETFDQSEIDGLIAFYRSPVGQAFVSKMPIVMQKSMQVSQERMKVIVPKMRAAMEQAMADAKLSNN